MINHRANNDLLQTLLTGGHLINMDKKDAPVRTVTLLSVFSNPNEIT